MVERLVKLSQNTESTSIRITTPEYLTNFQKAFEVGKQTIKYYLSKRTQELEYINSIQQRF